MMKKFGKLFLIMAVALVALFAMMTVASAATIDSVTASVAADEGRTISVTVAYGSPEAAQQSTILVVPAGTSIATMEDSAIKYIDQEAVDEKTVTYTFKLLEADRTGAYDVYVGGTAVDAPQSANFSFDTKKIIGTVVVLGDATKATAVAKTADGTEVKGAVAADGKYAIEVGQGTYDVVLGKAGYLYKIYKGVAAVNPETDLGTAELIGGDYNGDGKVTTVDIQNAILNFDGDSTAVDGYVIDLNDDGKISTIEIQNAILNFDKEGDK